jgi:dihydrofolate reductase
MGKVVLDITMSLDGFIAGPDISRENPLGKGGERLHNWLFKEKTKQDEVILNEVVETSGAVITGGRTYTTAIEDAWGGTSPFAVPAFVLSSKEPEIKVKGFTFCKDGIVDALSKSKKAAGDKNVWVMGGASTIQQFLKAGLFDEFHLHIVPVLFVRGTRLFDHIGAEQIELIRRKAITTPGATHFYFDKKEGR